MCTSKVKVQCLKQQRRDRRRGLGPLSGLTVQHTTQLRYKAALKVFFAYLDRHHVMLPRLRDGVDSLACDFLEHIWPEGEPKSLAANTLAALQNAQPSLKGHLPHAWRLLHAWNKFEEPSKAAPLPEGILHALVGWALQHVAFAFACSLLLGFYGLLRTGEIFLIQSKHIHISRSRQSMVLSLPTTKMGVRKGHAESVTIRHWDTCKKLELWQRRVSSSAFLVDTSSSSWRRRFCAGLAGLQLSSWSFAPYSLSVPKHRHSLSLRTLGIEADSFRIC